MTGAFSDRQQAGKLLAVRLKNFKNKQGVIVAAIPRGGVVVGAVLAKALHLPITAIVVKKLGSPNNPELAFGAVCADGTTYVDEEMIARLDISASYLQKEIEEKKQEAAERARMLGIDETKLTSCQSVILTDDGIATGATIEAAICCLKKIQTLTVILAIPVAPRDTIQRLGSLVDEIVVLQTPEFFNAVGQFYESFDQVSEEEVKRLLVVGSKQ